VTFADFAADFRRVLDMFDDLAGDDGATGCYNRSTDISQRILRSQPNCLAKCVPFSHDHLAAFFLEFLDHFADNLLAHGLAKAEAALQCPMCLA